MNLTKVKNRDLINLGRLSGKHCKVNGQHLASSPVIQGSISLSKTFSDLTLHYSESTELRNLSTSLERPAGLTVGVLLKGKILFSLDNERFEINDEKGPICFAFNLARSCQWGRSMIKGNHVIKAVVTLPFSWLSQRFGQQSHIDTIIKNLLCGHKHLYTNEASDKATKLCEEIVANNQQCLSDIEIESLALAFIATCIKNIGNVVPDNTSTVRTEKEYNTTVNSTALKIRSFIEKNILHSSPPTEVDLNKISTTLGISVSTAQRQFKIGFKQTILEYIRTRRLEIAREQLLKNASIGEVAYQAGYKHTPNFTYAFKKMFGETPGDVQAP